MRPEPLKTNRASIKAKGGIMPGVCLRTRQAESSGSEYRLNKMEPNLINGGGWLRGTYVILPNVIRLKLSQMKSFKKLILF